MCVFDGVTNSDPKETRDTNFRGSERVFSLIFVSARTHRTF